ncbi:PREDICTED: cyclin-dependent kinase inhibitor 4-like isoform X1 [Camelina sativa]|uniref:Cyclin-dependent kinase inhibitor 4-like isoform X1 n=1 Tax=Camelina sativa TaxID=90675 RepID=A0ABM0Z3P7_CAMSA|nr:PREDICTED: cyclin-dependent kinase inhibitor 4-like isoform X1 [Camelina sativa]
MGKYIRKSKIDGGEALMDVVSPSSSSSLGVLTRAKSLALQQQQQQQRRLLRKPSSSSSSLPPTSPTPNPPKKQRKQKQSQQMNDCTGTGSYLQLRSRRLQKKPPIVLIRRKQQQRRKETCGRNPNPSHNPQNHLDSVRSDGSRSDSVSESVVFGKNQELVCEINKDPSFGEATQQRTTRESTPCSLIGKPEIITTPGSSTKLNICISESNQREESLSRSSLRHLPTTPEMDEFFSGAEEEQQKQFIEKYNFDPVNEQPLPGRFEWTKVDD